MVVPVVAVGLLATGAAISTIHYYSVANRERRAEEAQRNSPVIRRPDCNSQEFRDWQAMIKAQRGGLRAAFVRAGLASPGDGMNAHHVIPIGDPKSARARCIMWRCGMGDIMNLMDNGIMVKVLAHRKMHTAWDYHNWVRVFIDQFDPDGFDPCGQSSFGGQGIRRALDDMRRYIRTGEVPAKRLA